MDTGATADNASQRGEIESVRRPIVEVFLDEAGYTGPDDHVYNTDRSAKSKIPGKIRILRHLGLPTDLPEPRPARAPPHLHPEFRPPLGGWPTAFDATF